MTQLSIIPTIHSGAYTEIGAFCRIENSSFGDYSYIGQHSQVDFSSVGKFCSIRGDVEGFLEKSGLL